MQSKAKQEHMEALGSFRDLLANGKAPLDELSFRKLREAAVRAHFECLVGGGQVSVTSHALARN